MLDVDSHYNGEQAHLHVEWSTKKPPISGPKTDESYTSALVTCGSAQTWLYRQHTRG